MAQQKKGTAATKNTRSRKSTKSTNGKAAAAKTGSSTAKRSSKSRNTVQPNNTVDSQLWAIIMLACALLLLLLAFVNGDKGWNKLHNIVKGSLGISAYIFPCLLAYIAILTAMEKEVKSKMNKVLIIGIFTVALSSSFYIFKAHIYAEDISYLRLLRMLYEEGVLGEVTGVLSGIFGYPIYKLLGLTGAKIVILMLVAVLFMIITGVTLKTIIRVISKPVEAVKNASAYRNRYDDEAYEDDESDGKYSHSCNSSKGKAVGADYGIDVPLDENDRRRAKDEELTVEKFRKITNQSKKEAKYKRKRDKGIDIALDDEDVQVETDELLQAETNEKLERLKELIRNNNIDNLPDYQIASVIAAELTRQKMLESKSNPEQKQPDPQTVAVDVSAFDVRNRNEMRSSKPKAVPINVNTSADKSTAVDEDANIEELQSEPYNTDTNDVDAQYYEQPVYDEPVQEAAPRSEKKRKADKNADINSMPEEINKLLARAQEEENDQSGEYRYPPLSLLNPVQYTDDSAQSSELSENGQKLIDTLKSFGVAARIVDICRGPSVTRYEIQPAPGVKISKITNLSDDIALNLAASGVRMEAPIPGKAAVGIEIPNKVVSLVTIKELIGSKEFKNAKSMLSVVLGKDISGDIMLADLSKMPHLLIAGTTGSGKSVCVNSILLSLLFRSTPKDVRILLIDPKMVEFSKYKGIPHLLIPVVSDAKKAAGALNWAVSEMLKRYQLFAEYSVRDLQSYNKLVEQNLKKQQEVQVQRNLQSSVDGGNEENDVQALQDDAEFLPNEKMPQIVIAIDELADLMMAAPNEVEESICRLAQMARAAGMHLVIATQRPSVNVITGVIKANIPSRIALKVSSQIDSRTILDVGGAEKLIGRGDMLFSPVGAAKPIRVQGGYASDEEIENVTDFLKKSHISEYDEDVIEQIEKIAAQDIGKEDKKGTADAESSDDPMMEEAIKVVVEAGQASTSLLQRRLRLGYARAGRLIDEMEQMGIVGPHEGSKSRQVLMSHQEWLERQNRLC